MVKVESCRTRAGEICLALCALMALIFFTVSAPNLAAAQQNPTETETFVQVELGQALGFAIGLALDPVLGSAQSRIG